MIFNWRKYPFPRQPKRKKIEDNGKTSSGHKIKHMDNRYFGIKDILKYEGIKVEYRPTEKMIPHFFTKLLQDGLFKKFWDIVLGYKHISNLHEDDEYSLSQERVGKDVFEGNVKQSDDSPSVVGSAQRSMRYAEAVSKRQTTNRMIIDNNPILLK